MLSPKLFLPLPALIAIAALALGGCGSGGGDEAASPLDEALGYLSEDAGFALIASTELGDYDNFRDILDKFPFGGQIEDQLRQSLEEEGVDFEDDVEPLLGNEVVIGTDDNASFTADDEDTPFVMALETGDGDKLRDLVERDGREQGESEGYDVFQGQEDDTWLAIKDEVVVLSDSEDTLKQALKQRGEDDRLTEEAVDAAFEDLPEDAPVKGYVNLGALLAADPDTEDALKIKWVDHLETLGFTANATADAVSIDYAARTDPEGLSDDDWPLASGSEAPRLLERGDGAEVLVSLRDPSQVVDFALAAAKVVDPAGYAQFQTGKQAIGRRLGVDVDEDVIAQLTGDVSAAVTIDGKFGVRAELDDPGTFEDTLAKVMDGLPEFSDDLTVTKPKSGGGFYALGTENGQTYAIGVADGSLVVANNASLADEVAARGLAEAEGLTGAFVVSADAEKIANEALAQFAGGLEGLGGSLFTGPLGDLLSSAEASTDGIVGKLELEIE
jgi:Protein of unknown function (DUF3352)